MGVAESRGGQRLHVFAGEHHWKLPECLHCADTGRLLDRFAGVALPALRKAHRVVRQCACIRVAVARRKMPRVPYAYFPDVPARGTQHGTLVRRVLPEIWAESSDGEMALLYRLAHRFDDYRLARAHASGRSELAGSGCRLVFLCHGAPK